MRKRANNLENFEFESNKEFDKEIDDMNLDNEETSIKYGEGLYLWGLEEELNLNVDEDY